MLGIIKKDLFRFVINPVIIIPLLTVYLIYSGGIIDTTMIILMNILLYLLILGPVLITELSEEKNKGYDFLGQLPVKTGEIVAAKFIMPLVVAAVLTGYYFLLFAWFSDSAISTVFEKVSIMVCGTVCLLTVGFTYIGTFAFGYVKFVRFGLVALLSLNVIVTIIFQRFARTRLNIDISRLVRSLADLNVLYIIGFALIIYFMLMLVAVKIRNHV